MPGGAQMSTKTLCEGLVQTEFEPVVVCPRLLSTKPEQLPFRVVEYVSDENRENNQFRRILNLFRRIGAFYRIIKAERPDILHIQMSESLITFGALRCLGIFKKQCFIYTDRGLYYGYREHSMMCMKAVLRYAAKMICTTQFNKKLWLEHSKLQKIEVIPNTIGKAFTAYDAEKRKLLREKENLSETDFVIGFAGRICEEKDWPVVKRLIPALKAKGISFKVALVLSVFEEQDMAVVQDLKEFIIQTIGEENLIYRQDISQAEMAEYYYLVDVFVMTSQFESFGKAAVEAMSRRCAVISTNAGGLPEVVGKQENLYYKENSSKCVSRIYKLYQDIAELNQDKDYFYKRYIENYTEERNLAAHIKLYRTLKEGRR